MRSVEIGGGGFRNEVASMAKEGVEIPRRDSSRAIQPANTMPIALRCNVRSIPWAAVQLVRITNNRNRNKSTLSSEKLVEAFPWYMGLLPSLVASRILPLVFGSSPTVNKAPPL